MAKKFIKIPKPTKPLKLTFLPIYEQNLKEVMEFSVATFGKRVAKEFLSEIRQKIVSMRNMPNMYAKCRFIDSNEKRTFRNIVVRSFYVVYVVTAQEIIVLDIVHQSISPENMKKRVE
jgi:plasmid stabilization system protein ParE